LGYIFYPNCVSHELSPSENKRGSSYKDEQASTSNATKGMPVGSQKGSYLPHVSPSNIMPVPKADTALKRRGQRRDNTAIMTSNPYFKKLRDKSNPTLGSYRRAVPSKRRVFEKCEAKSKRQLKKSTPDTGTKNEENTACMFCDELFFRTKLGEEWVRCSGCKKMGTYRLFDIRRRNRKDVCV
jgi:hypothetical protein